METKSKLKVHNVPEYAGLYDYIVYRSVDGEAWFYGAYNDLQRASKVAEEVHGYIAEVRNIEAV